jgi:competence protein ComEA
VNLATPADWLQLSGIGSTFASRITNHREILGGFSSIEQVKEVHGITDSLWRIIVPHLKLSAPIFRKLQVNKSSAETMKHPYLSRKQAEVLVRYRQNHGDFRSIEDLRKAGILPAETIERLRNYIEF